MRNPKPDGRTVRDLIAEIRKKSVSYTPEWRFDPDDMDAGGALATIFSEMFFETIDRYNRFPDKCYLEFLNMQGVCAKPVSPAVGLAAATLVDGAPEGVYVKAGTQLFTDLTDAEGDERRVVFETTSGFCATPAEVRVIYMTDPVRDIITRTEPDAADAFPLMLFAPRAQDNLERHRFSLSHNAVLRLMGKSEIRVGLSHTGMSFRSDADLSRLTDPVFAVWSYPDGETLRPLTARRDGEHIVLTKDDDRPLVMTDENGEVTESAEDGGAWRIFCDMTALADAEDIAVDSIVLGSRSLEDEDRPGGIVPTYLFANDTEMERATGDYCFGREPSVYDCFYLCCDEALSKRGAGVTLELAVAPIIVQEGEESDEDAIEFNQKLLVDKADAQVKPYDDIYISEVVWEYWNGYGWARLDVGGDINPFSCRDAGGKKTLTFTCPDDLESSMQNAREGMWLRARIRRMENRFSTHARWMLPLLKGAGFRFDYGATYLPAEQVTTTNNCETRLYENRGAKVEMRLFGLMPEKHHALYFRFDAMPNGYPVNFHFDLVGSTDAERVITYEYLCGDRSGRTEWCELKAVDRTHGFEHSGILSLYAPSDFAQAEMFGASGYWIRAVNRTMRFNPDPGVFPKLSGITRNTVEIIQRESVRGELHEVREGVADQVLMLTNRPVIDCAVWIDELPETPLGELQKLMRADSSRVRTVTDAAGALTEFWVRWEPRATLADCPSDARCYTPDATAGTIRFGDGVNGKIPAYHTGLQVSVDYSFGGGAVGNLPAGALDGLIVSIPFVDSMTNIAPTCGGSNEQSIETVRRIGTKRLKHYGRAVTAEDFESLVLEEFNEVAQVRCFPNRRRDCTAQNGYVTVVVMPHEMGNASYASSLCRRIEEFLCARAGCELVAGKRLSVIPAVPMKVSAEISVRPDDYDHAAETEREIIAAVSTLFDGAAETDRIGVVPRTADVMAAIKRLEHVSHIQRVLLVGEYTLDNELVTIPLDGEIGYRYFVAVNGTHTVKIS